MKFESFITRRYLFSKRRFQFISLINRLSTIGIVIGVASLVIVLSIFNGFTQYTEEKLYESDSHLKIYDFDERELTLLEPLLDGVKQLSSLSINSKAVLNTKSGSKVVELKSYKNEDYLKLVRGNVVNGLEDDLSGVMMGSGLAAELKLYPGDEIKIQTPEMIKRQLATYRKTPPINVDLISVVRSGIVDQDKMNAFVDWSNAKKLWRDKTPKNFELILDDPYESKVLKRNISKLIPNKTVETWQDRNQRLLFMMEFERYASFLIVGLIVLIALFNLFASITMTVLEKIRDISLLRVMGASNSRIKSIFLRLGIINGSLGVLLGLFIGVTLVLIQKEFALIKIVDNYFSQAVPVYLDPLDLVLVVIYSFIMTYVASSYPAKFALEKNPSEGIRFIE